jgi:hypothetical protein
MIGFFTLASSRTHPYDQRGLKTARALETEMYIKAPKWYPSETIWIPSITPSFEMPTFTPTVERSTSASSTEIQIEQIISTPDSTFSPTITIYFAPSITPLFICTCRKPPNLNCPDLPGIQGQICFDYCQSLGYDDVYNLDGDSDGLACEDN